jgi:toxin ParE1/3/4
VVDVFFHPEAQSEYVAGLAWYRARSSQAAARFELEMERVLGLIAANPELYPKYNEQHRFAVMRRFPYSVVYQIQPTLVFVVAIAHSSRSAGYWQGRT